MDALGRVRAVLRFFGALTLCLLGVLARYQVLGSLGEQQFQRPAFQQRYKGVPVSLPRGCILDRNRVPIHYPVWGVSLAVFPCEISQPDKLKTFLSESLGIDADSLISASSAVKVKRCLGPDEVALVRSLSLSGLEVIPDEIRYGPRALAAHVVGHICPKDNRGESGLECQFQYLLAGGKPSWVGYVTTGEGVTLPESGLRIAPNQKTPQDLVTTIDAKVQMTVEEVLDHRGVTKGAVVVLDVSRGEVLAMASRPNFDQNDPGKTSGDPDDPLVNRAITAFAAGPLLEPVALGFALDKGICRANDVLQDRAGSIAKTRQGLEPEELEKYARGCGFLELTGIPLPGERPGSLEDLEGLLTGDGGLTATPLQMAAFYRAIACGGLWRQPALIFEQEGREVRIMSSATANTIGRVLLDEVRAGAGRKAWVALWGSAGWSGTAWFCGWAPLILPKYVISVFVQEGGDGPNEAAPLFREIAQRLLPGGNGNGTRTPHIASE